MTVTHSYTGMLGTANGTDYYQFELSQAASVDFQLTTSGVPANITLLNAAGKTIAGISSDEITNLAAGTYFIEVSDEPGFSSSANNLSYSLTVAGTPLPIIGGASTASAKSLGVIGATPVVTVDWAGSANEEDFYSFTLATSGQLNLALSGTADGDVLSLLDSFGNNLANSSASAGYNGSIVKNLSAGTYYVEVDDSTATFSSNYVGSNFSLSAWVGAPSVGTAGSDGAGNSLTAARNLGALGATVQTFADWVGAADTDDYYKFTLSSAATVSALVSGLVNGATLYLFDAGDDQLDHSYGYSYDNASINQSLVAGTYYVDVNGSSNTGYNLSLSAESIANVAGATLKTAQNIGTPTSVAQNYTGNLFSGVSDAFYALTVSGVTRLNLSMSGLTTSATLYLDDASGAKLYGYDGSPESPANFTYYLAAGTYYIDANSASADNGVATPYILAVSATTIPEPAGSTMSTALAVGALSSTAQTFSGWLGAVYQDNYYKLTLSSAATVNILWTGSTGIAEPTLMAKLLTVSGAQVAYGYSSASSEGSIVYSLASGTYYVDMNYYTNNSASYNLSISTGVPAIGNSSSNIAGNSISTAKNIGALGAAPQVFAEWVGTIDTADYYEFSLSQASATKFLVSGCTANSDFDLLDIAGHVIASGSAGAASDGSLLYQLASGTYYFEVTNSGGDNTGYNLSMSAAAIVDTAGTTVTTAPDIGDLAAVPPTVTITAGEASSQASQAITGTVASSQLTAVVGQTVTLTDNGVALSTSAAIKVQSDGSFSASVLLPNAGINAIVASVTDTNGLVGTSAAVDDWLTTTGVNSSSVDGLSLNVGDNVNLSVGGAGDYLNITGASAVVTATGAKDDIALVGVNDWAALNGTGEAETATGSGGYVVMNGGNDFAAMNGPKEAASASLTGAGDFFTLGGSNEWVTMYGANDGATATGVDVSVTQGGSGDWANLTGQGDAMTATGSTASATLGGANEWATLNGSGDAGTATGATDYVVLGSSNEWVALKGAAGAVTGSGNGDYVEFGGSSSTADLTGTNESYVFDASFGNVVISDFNATSDTMQFSKSDFASWSTLSPGHIAQGALGAVITFDAADTVTLKGVSAGSLVSTHFSFV